MSYNCKFRHSKVDILFRQTCSSQYLSNSYKYKFRHSKLDIWFASSLGYKLSEGSLIHFQLQSPCSRLQIRHIWISNQMTNWLAENFYLGTILWFRLCRNFYAWTILWFPLRRNFNVWTILWRNGARAAKAGCIVVWGEFAQIGGIFKYRPQPGPIIIRTGRTMSRSLAKTSLGWMG